jgi:hypothetical protein
MSPSDGVTQLYPPRPRIPFSSPAVTRRAMVKYSNPPPHGNFRLRMGPNICSLSFIARSGLRRNVHKTYYQVKFVLSVDYPDDVKSHNFVTRVLNWSQNKMRAAYDAYRPKCDFIRLQVKL